MRFEAGVFNTDIVQRVVLSTSETEHFMYIVFQFFLFPLLTSVVEIFYLCTGKEELISIF